MHRFVPQSPASSHGKSAARIVFSVVAACLFGSITMPSLAHAASLAGKWILDGVPAQSGTGSMTATIAAAADKQWQLTLPADLLPSVGGGDVVLHQDGPDAYRAKTSAGSDVILTVTSPGHAHLEIAGKSALSKFAVNLTQARE